MALKKICNYSGCNTLIDVGQRYCDKHKVESRQYDKYRGTSTERGYNGKWRKARNKFLKDNPLCIECLKDNTIEPATVVDHIKPHKGDMGLFWDKDNWQALCKKHHDIKTAKEDGGFGNRRGG